MLAKNYDDFHPFLQVFLKAHFDYDPKRDNLIPCRDAGLPFKAGDILRVVNKDDNSWWQVSGMITINNNNNPDNNI